MESRAQAQKMVNEKSASIIGLGRFSMAFQFPKFSGAEEEKVEQCIRWTWNQLQKVDWSSDEVKRRLFLESPIELAEKGQVFYMHPCGSLTLTFVEALKANGIRSDVVIDFLKIKEHVFPHFAVEIPLSKELSFVEFETRKVSFKKSPYRRTWIPGAISLRQFRVPASKFSPNLPIPQNMGAEILQEGKKLGYRVSGHKKLLSGEVAIGKFEQFQKTAKPFVIRRK